MKALFDIEQKFRAVGPENCFISEITLAELKFGVENSTRREHNRENLRKFLSQVQVIPIFDALDTYASEKARLRATGIVIDDFDLLIGATAITHELVMVTNNTAHFKNLNHITLEDWTK